LVEGVGAEELGGWAAGEAEAVEEVEEAAEAAEEVEEAAEAVEEVEEAADAVEEVEEAADAVEEAVEAEALEMVEAVAAAWSGKSARPICAGSCCGSGSCSCRDLSAHKPARPICAGSCSCSGSGFFRDLSTHTRSGFGPARGLAFCIPSP